MTSPLYPQAAGALDRAVSSEAMEFGNFFLSRFLDLQISYDDEEQTCVVVFPFADHLLNPQGSVHGGIITTAMDISMGHLLRRHLSPSMTVEIQLRFFRPLTTNGTCTGRIVRPGRRLVTAESRLTDAEGKFVALAMSTWHRLDALDTPRAD